MFMINIQNNYLSNDSLHSISMSVKCLLYINASVQAHSDVSSPPEYPLFIDKLVKFAKLFLVVIVLFTYSLPS